MRGIVPTGELLDMGNLGDYWATIDREFDLIEALPPLASSRTLSARAFDEAQPAGTRAYMQTSRYLGVAHDNHAALVALLKSHGATVWAPWSLLRPTFEASFFALWLLDPESGLERRRRGLRCEIMDTLEQRKHRSAFKSIPGMAKLIDDDERRIDRSAIAAYKLEAASLGMTWDKAHQRITVVDCLKTLSIAKPSVETATMLEATWRQLSGYEHGLGWAAMSGSSQTITAHVPGGADVRFVIDDSAFVNAAKTTYLLLVTACRTLQRRHTEPSRS